MLVASLRDRLHDQLGVRERRLRIVLPEREVQTLGRTCIIASHRAGRRCERVIWRMRRRQVLRPTVAAVAVACLRGQKGQAYFLGGNSSPGCAEDLDRQAPWRGRRPRWGRRPRCGRCSGARPAPASFLPPLDFEQGRMGSPGKEVGKRGQIQNRNHLPVQSLQVDIESKD